MKSYAEETGEQELFLDRRVSCGVNGSQKLVESVDRSQTPKLQRGILLDGVCMKLIDGCETD